MADYTELTPSELRTLIKKAKRVNVFVCMTGTSQYFPTTKKAALAFASAHEGYGQEDYIECPFGYDADTGTLEIG